MTLGETETLATYKAEKARGLMHTPEWHSKMADLQAQQDADRRQQGRRWLDPKP